MFFYSSSGEKWFKQLVVHDDLYNHPKSNRHMLSNGHYLGPHQQDGWKTQSSKSSTYMFNCENVT
jgi:hypothetical protein